MIRTLIGKYGNALPADKAHDAVTAYVNDACEQILECTAVFKNTSQGQAAFDRFMSEGLKLKA